MSDLLSNPKFLKDQYGTSTQSLRARISIYEQFLSGQIPWHDWLYERLDIRSGCRIADAGCGTGDLWLRHSQVGPVDCRIDLIDQSKAMVNECRRRFRNTRNLRVLHGNAQLILAREQHAYDCIVASHVMYHLSEPKAFIETCLRALAKHGFLGVTTVGSNHLRQLKQHLEDFAEKEELTLTPTILSFTKASELESLLKNSGRLEIEPYYACLVVTEVAPLVNYILSTNLFSQVQNRKQLEIALTTYFEKFINSEKSLTLDVHNWLAVVRL